MAVAALFAPVMPLWWTQLHRAGADHWMPRPTLVDLYEAARKLAFGASHPCPSWACSRSRRFTSARTRRAAVHALGSGLLPVLACWAVGTMACVFAPNYMMFAIPSASARLFVAGLLRLARALSMVVSIGLLMLALRGLRARAPYPEADALAGRRPCSTSNCAGRRRVPRGHAHAALRRALPPRRATGCCSWGSAFLTTRAGT